MKQGIYLEGKNIPIDSKILGKQKNEKIRYLLKRNSNIDGINNFNILINLTINVSGFNFLLKGRGSDGIFLNLTISVMYNIHT